MPLMFVLNLLSLTRPMLLKQWRILRAQMRKAIPFLTPTWRKYMCWTRSSLTTWTTDDSKQEFYPFASWEEVIALFLRTQSNPAH